MAETELEMARRHVSEGEGTITRQRALVADLHAKGNIALALRAEEQLAAFVSLQRQHVSHLQRLMRAK